MKHRTINKIIATLAVCGVGFTSSSAIAAQDASQRQILQRIVQAKQNLQQVEAAKGAERQKLLADHMKSMREIMAKMQAMKPQAGMSMQEHEDWINEHQKLMDDMMGLMMQENRMMMNMEEMPMDKGDMHKK